MYICTEDAFPNRRLVAMVDQLKARCRESEVAQAAFMDNIFIEHAADVVGAVCRWNKPPCIL